jgi:radical SAM-linked protein
MVKEPAMMRVWIKFAKESPMRFLSHLDLLRVWQRAIRRAALPVAYSAGFNPHPKISFASALAVGVTSDGEYLDIQFAKRLDGAAFERLAETLPQGLKLLDWRQIPEATPALMSLVCAAQWKLTLQAEESRHLQEAVQNLLAASSLPVEREGKKGIKTVDIRPLIYGLEVDEKEACLRMRLASGGEAVVRPGEVLKLLSLPAAEGRLHRTELYLASGGCFQEPMAVLLN